MSVSNLYESSERVPLYEYIENIIEEPTLLYEKLLQEVPFTQGKVKVFGKEYDEPRLTALFGTDQVLDKEYIYSKSKRKLIPMNHTLLELRTFIYKITGIEFNVVLINYYRDGNDKIAYHSDDKTTLDDSNVVSLSLGCERRFLFRNKSTKEVIFDQRLANGSMIWMKKGCQDDLQHSVPVEKKVKQGRINLTFRNFK
jgi:hypothetical protein